MNKLVVDGRDISIVWDCGDNEDILVEVYRYGGLLQKLSSKKNLSFKAETDGVYRFVAYKVFADGNKKIFDNKIVEVFSEDVRKKYENFLKAEIPMIRNPIDYYPYKSPYSDFVICVNTGECDEINQIDGLTKSVYDEHTIIYSGGGVG